MHWRSSALDFCVRVWAGSTHSTIHDLAYYTSLYQTSKYSWCLIGFWPVTLCYSISLSHHSISFQDNMYKHIYNHIYRICVREFKTCFTSFARSRSLQMARDSPAVGSVVTSPLIPHWDSHWFPLSAGLNEVESPKSLINVAYLIDYLIDFPIRFTISKSPVTRALASRKRKVWEPRQKHGSLEVSFHSFQRRKMGDVLQWYNPPKHGGSKGVVRQNKHGCWPTRLMTFDQWI